MKKIFTLLLCAAGMTFAANAYDQTSVDQCIDALLAQDNNTRTLTEPSLDANQDGILSIADVTCMINEMIKAKVNAPKQEIDIQGIINQALKTETGEPNIYDVTDAVEKKTNDK